jgi:hypothetical protein
VGSPFLPVLQGDPMNARPIRAGLTAAAALAALAACTSAAGLPTAAPTTSTVVRTTAPPTPPATASLTPLPRSTKQFDLPVGTETKLTLPFSNGRQTVIALAVSYAVWQPAGACNGTAIGEYLTLTIRETVVSGIGYPLEAVEFDFVAASGRKAQVAPYSGCNHPALDATMVPNHGIIAGQLTFDVQTGHSGRIVFNIERDLASWTIT